MQLSGIAKQWLEKIKRRLHRPVVLLVLLVLMLVSAIWAATLWEIQSGRDGALEAENLKNANLALSQEERVQRSLQVLDQSLLVLRHDLTDSRAHETLEERIETLRLDRNFVGVVSILNAKADVVATSAQNLTSNFSDREYFNFHATHSEDVLLVGKPVQGRLTGNWLVSLTRRISNPDGSFGGLIFMAVNPAYFMTGYERNVRDLHATTALIGLDGITRVRNNNGLTSYGEDLRASQLFKEVTRARQGQYVGVAASDGQRRTVTYRVLEGHPLVVVVASSLEDVLAGRLETERIYIGLALLCTVLVACLAVIVNGTWSRIEDAMQKVRASEQKFRSIIDASPVPMATNDDRSNITYVNPAFVQTFGYAREDIPTLAHWWPKAYPDVLYRQKIMDQWSDELKRSAQTGSAFKAMETVLRCKDGSDKYAMVGAAEMAESYRGEHLVVLYDVTEQKSVHDSLRKMVLEKNALLKEVHHRVKNNLQVITSLLRLEMGRAGHARVKAVLQDMKGRIRSMALLHESLYRSGSFASVRLDVYIRQLATEVFRSLSDRNAHVSLALELTPVLASMSQATPCGLMVNELISNALKHGFPDGRTGIVKIEMWTSAASGCATLRVSDNGVGLPDDFESKRADSLGMQLVTDLALQIGSTLNIGPQPVAMFSFEFLPDGHPP